MGIQLADLSDAELDAFFGDFMRLEPAPLRQMEPEQAPGVESDHLLDLDTWPIDLAHAS